MDTFYTLIPITLIVIPLIFAITLHEVAHGFVALQLGDSTAQRFGRLTLNPIKHIDLIGTIIIPGLLLYLGGFIFGWAKPVPVDWSRLKNPVKDMALVAIAGPFSNLLMALFWGCLWKFGYLLDKNTFAAGLIYMSMFGVKINVILMILNLLPIPPLDGSRVLGSVLPLQWNVMMHRYEHYGFIILVMLLMSGILGLILHPMYQSTIEFIKTLLFL